MASSLFTDDEKDDLSDLLDNVHETFKKVIYAFVEENSNTPVDLNYNPIYGSYKDESKGITDNVLTKNTINARVKYFKKGEEDKLDDTGLTSSESLVRVKVTNADKETLLISSFVDIDGEKYTVVSDTEVIGPFGSQYYKLYLRRAT